MEEKGFHTRRDTYHKIQESIKSKMELKIDALKTEESSHKVPTQNDIYDIEIWNALYNLYEVAYKSGYNKCREDVKESLSYLHGG